VLAIGILQRWNFTRKGIVGTTEATCDTEENTMLFNGLSFREIEVEAGMFLL
jgi:hypothetical protein